MTERPDLDAIEALLTAATPGPWLADLDIFDPDDHEIEACVSNADVRILFTSGTGYTYGEAPEVERAAAWAAAKASQQMTDARLIAAAPLALREVIAYARALEQERDAAQARHDAEIAAVVEGLREQAECHMREEHAYRKADDYTGMFHAIAQKSALRDAAASIATTHAAALARHAGNKENNR